MSRKKYRPKHKAAHQPSNNSQDAQTTGDQAPHADQAGHAPESDGAQSYDEWLKGLSEEEFEKWRRYGESIRDALQTRIVGVSVEEGDSLSDDEVREYLANSVRFLNQVVNMTSVVLETVEPGYLRKIAAADCRPLDMHHALKVIGYDPEVILGDTPDPETTGKNPGKDWRKGPRGGRHPLVVLMKLAVSATRLIHAITIDTNPQAHNRMTPAEQADNRLWVEITKNSKI